VVRLAVDAEITPALAIERLRDLGPDAVSPLVAALDGGSEGARTHIIVVVLEGLGLLSDPVLDQAIAALPSPKRASAHLSLADTAAIEANPAFFSEESPSPDLAQGYDRAALHHYEQAIEAAPGTDVEKQSFQIGCLRRLLDVCRHSNDGRCGDAAVARLLKEYPQREDAVVAAALYRADTGRMTEAERLLRAEVGRSSHGAEACRALADVLARPQWPGGLSRRDDACAVLMECAEAHPSQAERHLLLAEHYWHWAYRDDNLAPQRRIELADSGLRAIDQALSLSAENPDALVYKSLLCRVKAEQLPEGPERQALLDRATSLRTQALAIKRRRRTGEDRRRP
jgi:hypothetical protein